MFATIIIIIGAIVSLLGWPGATILLGILLEANTHPRGAGWVYLAVVIVGHLINRNFVADKQTT